MPSASCPRSTSWNCQLSADEPLRDLPWPGCLPIFGALARSLRCAPAAQRTSGSEAQLGDNDPGVPGQAASLCRAGLCCASSKHPSMLHKQERNACLSSHLGSLMTLRPGLESQL